MRTRRRTARALPFFPVLHRRDGADPAGGATVFPCVFGFELMSLASWAMVLARHEEAASRDAAQLYLGIASFGAACLIPALALLAPFGPHGLRPALRRDPRRIPPEGWRATAILLLVLLGAGSKAGLAPLHVWLPLAHPAAPSHVSALMSGAMTKVALYVLDPARVRSVRAGAAAVVERAGAGGGRRLGGARRVAGQCRGRPQDRCWPRARSRMSASSRSASASRWSRGRRTCPGLRRWRSGRALLHALNHGLFKTLLFLGAGAAQHGAGSRLLARLGGLIHPMPVTTVCVLAGCSGLAALPPGPGSRASGCCCNRCSPRRADRRDRPADRCCGRGGGDGDGGRHWPHRPSSGWSGSRSSAGLATPRAAAATEPAAGAVAR